MIEMCSCYGCGYDCGSRSQSQSRSRLNIIPHLRDRDSGDSGHNPHHHINNQQHNSHQNHHHHHPSKMVPSSCFSAQFPVRSSRSFKGACLLTAAIAFCVGIGIGILIPLYFLPVSGDPTLNFNTDSRINSNNNFNNSHRDIQHLTLTPQPVIIHNSNSNNNDYVSLNLNSGNSANERTLDTNNYNTYKIDNLKTDDEEDETNQSSSSSSTTILDDQDSVSMRFPEFAQIQALRQDRERHRDKDGSDNNNNNSNESNNKKTVQKPKHNQREARVHPMFRRPSSNNVKFVVPDSRILSLHPVQPEIPPARFNYNNTATISLSPHNHNDKINSAVNSENSLDDNHSHKIRDSSNLLDGVYWSEEVENNLPKGFTDEDIKSWRRFVNKSSISKIEEGCGRMQNRLLSMENGTRACCRYRHNFDQIQGEIFSFYLSQILNIRNLAPSALNIIQPMDKKWSNVRQQLNLAQWVDEKPVVLTRFIDSLKQAYIPTPFRDSSRRLHPIDIILSPNFVDSMDINELAQWSDLIVFDYLTANLDRMVNNLYNLQWNPSMMEAPAHNLAKDESTGLLIFLDNESGLLHGYRLLDKYEQYHRVMLDSLCVFRKSTAEAVKRLHRDKNVGHLLKTMFQTLEPNLVNYLPIIPDKSIKILNHRIDRVYDQISKCESLYMS